MEKESISIEQEKNIVREVMKPISIYVIINLIVSTIFAYDVFLMFGLCSINFFIGLINMCAVSKKKARESLDKAKSRINAYILGRFAFILWLFLFSIVPMGSRCMCGHVTMNTQPMILYFIVYISAMVTYMNIMKSGKNKIVKIDMLGLITIVITFLLTMIVYGYNATFPDPHML